MLPGYSGPARPNSYILQRSQRGGFEPVEYLYGDSTTSSLTMDFVDFLRRGFDCFVAVLQAEQRMVRGAIRRRELELHADQNIARLRELEVTVSRALTTLVGK